jgi:hypothetical protein
MNEHSSATFLLRQKLLIGEARVKQSLDEVISYLENVDGVLQSRVFQIISRYNYNQNQFHQGVISDGEARIEFNRINQALLDILDEINTTEKLKTPVSQKVNTHNLLNRIPNSNSIFRGRERELEEFGQAFGRYNFVAIEGVGGVGKTEFAIECIRRFVVDKERVMWVSPLMKFDVMIHQAGYGEMLKIEQLDDFQKFKNFEGLLDRDDRIVFLEDFHVNTDDNYTRFFEQFSLQKAKVIVVSRFLPTGLNPGAVIKLNGLGNDALAFAKDERSKKSQYEDITDDDLDILCKVV